MSREKHAALATFNCVGVGVRTRRNRLINPFQARKLYESAPLFYPLVPPCIGMPRGIAKEVEERNGEAHGKNGESVEEGVEADNVAKEHELVK